MTSKLEAKGDAPWKVGGLVWMDEVGWRLEIIREMEGRRYDDEEGDVGGGGGEGGIEGRGGWEEEGMRVGGRGGGGDGRTKVEVWCLCICLIRRIGRVAVYSDELGGRG